MKKIRSVEVNLETGQIFQYGTEIKCSYDIYKAYSFLACFEYLKDNYSNNDDILWQLAMETVETQIECEANANPITEGEAIELACDSLHIVLDEK